MFYPAAEGCQMHTYILKRLVLAIPAIFAITIIIFLAMRVLPGDPLTVIFGQEGAYNISETDRQVLLDSLGLDKPLYQQYGEWLKDVATLKLGESFWRGDSVMETIIRRGPITAEIAILAIAFSWLIGLPVGILAAMKHNSIQDYLARFFTILFLAIPNFWLGAVVVLVFLLVFSWHPPPEAINLWDDLAGNMQIVLLPAAVLGLSSAAYIARMARSSLLEVIREDYIRTARAKGLRERVVVLRHALQNAILPVITLSGVLLGYLLGGSVAVEKAFGVPGLGTTLIKAFVDRDYVVIQNLVLLYGLIFIVLNLIIDMAYGWLDPRIRYE